MTPIQKTEAIRSACASGLPSLLSTAGLDDFNEYLNKTPLRSTDNELAVYIDYDDNMTDGEQFAVLIQCQINGTDNIQEYHSVIMPFLKGAITEDVVKMQWRDFVKADIYPLDVSTNNSFAFYSISFSNQLDDCN